MMNANSADSMRGSLVLALVFTDLVGSTRMKQLLGDSEGVGLMQRHHGMVRELLEQFPGAQEANTAGDSFFLTFARASEAIQFSLLLQKRLRALATEVDFPIADRVGIHVGEVVTGGDEGGGKGSIYGTQVDLCARVMSLAGGNQILLTRAAFESARQASAPELGPGEEVKWVSHGRFLLKGVEEPVEIYEVGEKAAAPFVPPEENEKVQRFSAGGKEPLAGWRPAAGQNVPGTSWVLREQLGEGAFGEVWLGIHTQLKERRVFKFCFRTDHARSLKREATLFRVLKEKIGEHPNIVKLYDLSILEPPFYLVVEHLEGKDLRAWLEEQGGAGAVPREVRLEIVAQIAEGLAVAHEAGIIHRDIKPSNVLIAAKGKGEGQSAVQVKVADFGIGQVASEEVLAGVTGYGFTQTMMTPGSESTFGTLLYMAPELFRGEAASPASDIYALGILLYQMLIGDLAKPLTTDWRESIESEVLREDLKRCLASDPAKRFQSARELAVNLRSVAERERRLAVEQRRAAMVRRAKPMAIAAGLALVLGLAGWSMFLTRMRAIKPTENLVREAQKKSAEEVSATIRFLERPMTLTSIQIEVILSPEEYWAGKEIGLEVADFSPVASLDSDVRTPDSSWLEVEGPTRVETTKTPLVYTVKTKSMGGVSTIFMSEAIRLAQKGEGGAPSFMFTNDRVTWATPEAGAAAQRELERRARADKATLRLTGLFQAGGKKWCVLSPSASGQSKLFSESDAVTSRPSVQKIDLPGGKVAYTQLGVTEEIEMVMDDLLTPWEWYGRGLQEESGAGNRISWAFTEIAAEDLPRVYAKLFGRTLVQTSGLKWAPRMTPPVSLEATVARTRFHETLAECGIALDDAGTNLTIGTGPALLASVMLNLPEAVPDRMGRGGTVPAEDLQLWRNPFGDAVQLFKTMSGMSKVEWKTQVGMPDEVSLCAAQAMPVEEAARLVETLLLVNGIRIERRGEVAKVKGFLSGQRPEVEEGRIKQMEMQAPALGMLMMLGELSAGQQYSIPTLQARKLATNIVRFSYASATEEGMEVKEVQAKVLEGLGMVATYEKNEVIPRATIKLPGGEPPLFMEKVNQSESKAGWGAVFPRDAQLTVRSISGSVKLNGNAGRDGDLVKINDELTVEANSSVRLGSREGKSGAYFTLSRAFATDEGKKDGEEILKVQPGVWRFKEAVAEATVVSTKHSSTDQRGQVLRKGDLIAEGTVVTVPAGAALEITLGADAYCNLNLEGPAKIAVEKFNATGWSSGTTLIRLLEGTLMGSQFLKSRGASFEIVCEHHTLRSRMGRWAVSAEGVRMLDGTGVVLTTSDGEPAIHLVEKGSTYYAPNVAVSIERFAAGIAEMAGKTLLFAPNFRARTNEYAVGELQAHRPIQALNYALSASGGRIGDKRGAATNVILIRDKAKPEQLKNTSKAAIRGIYVDGKPETRNDLQPLGAGDRIELEPEFMVDLFMGDNGPVVRVKGGSRMVINHLRADLFEGEATIYTDLLLERGEIIGNTKAFSADSTYRITTPYLTFDTLDSSYEIGVRTVLIERGEAVITYQVEGIRHLVAVGEGQKFTLPEEAQSLAGKEEKAP